MNVAAPEPITNRALMCALPAGLPHALRIAASKWMLEVGAFFLRTETELIIKSRRVVPGRLSAAGFEFRFPQIDSAMADLVQRCKTKRADLEVRPKPSAHRVDVPTSASRCQ